MKESEIEEWTRAFLERQKNLKGETDIFSSTWRKDLVRRAIAEIRSETASREVEDLPQVTCEQIIERVHWAKVPEMFERREAELRNQYRGTLSDVDVGIIMAEATYEWLEEFNANKSKKSTDPERNFLNLKVANSLADYVAKYNIKNVTILSVDDISYLEDTKEYLNDDDEIRKDAEAEKEDSDKEFLATAGIDSLPVKFGGQFYPKFAFEEVFRYYSLADQLEYTSVSRPIKAAIVSDAGGRSYSEIGEPRVKSAYLHDKGVLSKIHIDLNPGRHQLEVSGTEDSQEYYQRRWEILRSADNLRWMELAVSKLRESIEKKNADLSRASVKLRSKFEFAPTLGCVVVCQDGTHFTCFKGKIDQLEKSGLGKKLALEWAWTKHCEYSLFEEEVTQNNMYLLKGGSMFVTLEPCNSRAKIQLNGKLKLPCAVRCVEAELKEIFIGSIDLNKHVSGKGFKILRTGEYEFDP